MRVSIVIPAHNEETVIEKNLRRLFAVYEGLLYQYDWEIVVAENGSTDKTYSIVKGILEEFSRLRLINTEPGKGRAIRTAWMNSEADAYLFMDADLASDINSTPELLSSLHEADIAVGSRLLPDSKVTRSAFRKFQSRVYNKIARAFIRCPVADLQCGFKAVRREIVEKIVPKIQSDGYFFDTELIALSYNHGYKIAEVPIEWIEFPNPERGTQISSIKNAHKFIIDLWKLRKRLHS